ncbi:MAG: GNAT family N-acetyltransferase [Chloroflexi bacterium]|nr:GNAT family N-acetyltransferase [Chloroflexota bacterium]
MIEGTHVNLRPPEPGDAERGHRWINDAEVTRYLNMRYGASLAAEEIWFDSHASNPLGFHHAFFAIETKEGVHIGNVNFHETSPEDRSGRLGIMIGEPAYWSRGYGTDAMRTFCRFGFEEMNLWRIDLTVDERNTRARACYRRCGFVEEARLREHRFSEGAYHDILVMALLRDEWDAADAPQAAS